MFIIICNDRSYVWEILENPQWRVFFSLFVFFLVCLVVVFFTPAFLSYCEMFLVPCI